MPERFKEANMSPASSDELAVGTLVMAMGEENQDGSITARRIVIVTSWENFENFNFRPSDPSADSEARRGPMPEGTNPEEFRNLSQEERKKRMQEIHGDSPQGAKKEGLSFASVQGEILDKDESTITIKLIEEGSELVFYNSDTQITKDGDK